MDARDPVDPERAHEIDDADDRESPYGLLRRGQDLMRGRHFAQATIVLERAARMEPAKGSILEALGRASYNAGDHARAAEVFAELLEVDPSAHYAHYALGQSLKQIGRTDEARTHLRIAVALAPGSRLYASALRRLAGEGSTLVVEGGGPVTADDEADATRQGRSEGSGDGPAEPEETEAPYPPQRPGDGEPF
jgi:tetratricopeptide (TPR) repeat protein